MLKVEDVLVKENFGKWYRISMKDGEEVFAHVTQDVPDDPIVFCEKYGWDADCLDTSEIDSIISEIDKDDIKECSICEVSLTETNRAEENIDMCGNCFVNELKLMKYKIRNDLYCYNSKDELKNLLELLDNPIIHDVWDYDKITHLSKGYGLVTTWSTTGEFDDYAIPYCKIIDGAKLS